MAAYYSLLPKDTQRAWEMLSENVRAQIGGYDNYVAFWNTIDHVSVGDVSATGDVVTAHLTYTSNRGQEHETRQLKVERADGGWMISEDLGPVTS